MKIVVTGASGLLGYHLRCHFLIEKDWQVVPVVREDFVTKEKLAAKLKGADVVIHLAGMNRGEEKLVHETNIQITNILIEALEFAGSRAHVVFASSTHIFKDTSYGKAKLKCAEMLRAWVEKSGGSFTEFILPHVFGEFGKPFYNSAVSTFCYQLANSEQPKIIQDTELELVHPIEIVVEIKKIISHKCTQKDIGRASGRRQIAGYKILVTRVLEKLKEFDRLYRGGIVPKFENSFELYLFNTYRSYLYPSFYPVSLKLKTDDRGSLFEAVKTNHGGQGFLSTTKPGITRGNHYHFYKMERFCVVSGDAVIKIRKLFTDEVKEFSVKGTEPCFIDIPTLHTHNITNTGMSELTTLFWSHEIFNPTSSDTYPENVGLV